MRRGGVADVGCAGIRFHAQQRREVDLLTLGAQLLGPPLGRLEQCLLRRRHAPARHRELAAGRGVADDRRRIVREHARQRRQVAGAVHHGARGLEDRLLSLGDRIEVAHGGRLPSGRMPVQQWLPTAIDLNRALQSRLANSRFQSKSGTSSLRNGRIRMRSTSSRLISHCT